MKRNYKLDAFLALNESRKYLHDRPKMLKLTETYVETIRGIKFIGTKKQLELYREYLG